MVCELKWCVVWTGYNIPFAIVNWLNKELMSKLPLHIILFSIVAV